ncbi:MAG: DUF5985 family protein [Polyangiaceae bacterium]
MTTSALVKCALQSGAAAACFGTGVFLLRLYWTSRDRFFLYFCLGIWLLGGHWAVLALDAGPEKAHYLYATRALAFLLIIVAVIEKNRRR